MIAICLLFLVLSIAWAVYSTLIRPCLLDRIVVDFTRLQSQVDWSIIEGLAAGHERVAQELSQNLEDSETALSLSISMIIFGMLRYQPQINAQLEKERQLSQEMPEWIRQAHVRELHLTTQAAIANSPIWWPLLAALLLVAVFSGKTAKWWHNLQLTGSFMRAEGLTA